MKKYQEIAFISFANIAVAMIVGGILKLSLDDSTSFVAANAVMIAGFVFLCIVLFMAKRVDR